MNNHLELMALQAEVLFVHDGAVRITRINEAAIQPGPRFFWGHTSMGQALRFRNDLPEFIVNEIVEIMDRHMDDDKIANIIRTLEKDKPIDRFWIGPAYVCHEIKSPPLPDIVLVTDRNKRCLDAGFARLSSELKFREPCYMAIENDRAVSVCFTARFSDRAAEAGVETLEGFRGKGHAGRAVSAWCSAIKELNKIPLYSTSWDNYASQSIAKRLGFYQYGTDISFY